MRKALFWLRWPLVLAAATLPSAGQESVPFAERSLTHPGLQQALGWKSPPAAWDLNALTAAAFYWHSDLEVARAQLTTAQAGRETAATRPNPSLALVPQTTTPLRSYARGTYSANLDIPLETAGKRARRLEQAGNVVAASEAALASAAWSVRARLRLSLLNLYAARERTRLLRESVEHLQTSAGFWQRRLAAGETSLSEMLPSRLLAQQTEIALADAMKLEAEARAAASAAIGLPLAALNGAKLRLDSFGHLPTAAEIARLNRTAVAQRSDLVAARAEQAAAAAGIHGELGKRYPDLHVLPGYSYDDRVNKVELGFSFELPIFNQNKGPIAEARGRLAEAAARWHAAEARATGEYEAARVSYQAALDKLQRADRLFADEKKSVSAAESLVSAGESDGLSLSAARVEMDSSAVLRLDALIDAQRALGSLELATETAIDGWQPRLGGPPKVKR